MKYYMLTFKVLTQPSKVDSIRRIKYVDSVIQTEKDDKDILAEYLLRDASPDHQLSELQAIDRRQYDAILEERAYIDM